MEQTLSFVPKYRLRARFWLRVAGALSRALMRAAGAAGIPVSVTITVDDEKVDAKKLLVLAVK